MEQFKGDKFLSAEEITEKYPAFQNIPSHYVGLINENSGIVKARLALETIHNLLKSYDNCTLLFNTKVTEVKSGYVKTKDDAEYHAKDIGKLSVKLFKNISDAYF